jgi:hypothetical protein
MQIVITLHYLSKFVNLKNKIKKFLYEKLNTEF